jgi:hypothetical protein
LDHFIEEPGINLAMNDMIDWYSSSAIVFYIQVGNFRMKIGFCYLLYRR